MTKLFIPNNHYGENVIGGGHSFIRNLKDGADFDIIEGLDSDRPECDAVLISGCTMSKPEVARWAKETGKKLIYRIDNFTRNSRNGGKGWSRMKEFYELADVVVFQSEWAKNFVGQFLGEKKSVVIYNGVDLDIFKPSGFMKPSEEDEITYLYSRHNRDETKGWYKAWKFFIEASLDFKAKLFIAGQFEDALINHNFDFFNGENFEYLGDVSQSQMADVYRSSEWLIYPYYYDACSNTLIEALCSGCKPIFIDINKDDSAWEIEHLFNKKGREYFSNKRMAKEYQNVLVS